MSRLPSPSIHSPADALDTGSGRVTAVSGRYGMPTLSVEGMELWETGWESRTDETAWAKGKKSLRKSGRLWWKRTRNGARRGCEAPHAIRSSYRWSHAVGRRPRPYPL